MGRGSGVDEQEAHRADGAAAGRPVPCGAFRDLSVCWGPAALTGGGRGRQMVPRSRGSAVPSMCVRKRRSNRLWDSGYKYVVGLPLSQSLTKPLSYHISRG